MTVNQQKLDELHGRLFGEISAGYGGVMVALGDKLGLYKAIAAACTRSRGAAVAPTATSVSGSIPRSPAAMSTIIQARQPTS
jgi:hypothetical protein